MVPERPSRGCCALPRNLGHYDCADGWTVAYCKRCGVSWRWSAADDAAREAETNRDKTT